MRYTNLCRQQPVHLENYVTTWSLPEDPIVNVDWCLRPAHHLLIWLTFGEVKHHVVVSLSGRRWLNGSFNDDAMRLIAKLPFGIWSKMTSQEVELIIRLVITGP